MGYSVPISSGTYNLPGTNAGCADSSAYKVENDGGELIGKQVGKSSTGAATYAANVQGALAASSNTGFTDLAHRVGLANVVKMAAQYGVNVQAYGDGGSGLDTPTFGTAVGIALGIAPMTVNEQTQMLATIADNGMFHQAHIVKYWQQSTAGAEQPAKFTSHQVLTPSETAQVQYAMEATIYSGGTAYPNITYGTSVPGTVISKTGTTSSEHSGFFIGSTTQYTLVVGMFTESQDTKSADNLAELGGGGFGGYWPAKIWNTFAESNFSSSPTPFTTSPTFSGQTWNLVGKVTKLKPSVTCMVNGQKKKVSGKACPTSTPSPTPTCTNYGQQNCVTPSAYASPSASPTCLQFDQQGNCLQTGGATPSPTATASGGTSATPAPTCSSAGETGCTSTGTGGLQPQGTATAVSPKAGFAVAGTGLLLPGSLLWTAASRRRRRRPR
jgi:membrane peptidoglycan carboxypeptidase